MKALKFTLIFPNLMSEEIEKWLIKQWLVD